MRYFGSVAVWQCSGVSSPSLPPPYHPRSLLPTQHSLHAALSASTTQQPPPPPNSLDDVYSTGDTISLRFDRPTDRGDLAEPSGGKAYVDSLVAFSTPIAYDYSGEWVQVRTTTILL